MTTDRAMTEAERAIREAIDEAEAGCFRTAMASVSAMTALLAELDRLTRELEAARKDAALCQPSGLMFDALGKPRTRYVRVTLNRSHCVMHPSEGDRYVQDARDAGDDSQYTVTDVYLSEREFYDMPEFDGF